MRAIYLAVGLFLFSSVSLIAAENELLIGSQNIYNLPKGGVYVGFDYKSAPVATDKIRVSLSGAYCAPTYVAGILYTSVVDQAAWSSASKNAMGGWDIAGKNIYLMRVLINQPKLKFADCLLEVFANKLVGAGPGGAEETFVGVLDYQGGYDPNLMIPIYPARKVKGYRIAIPAYCTGIEVLESGVTMESTYEKSKLLDKGTNSYAVNDGHGLIISGINMKLNGPAEKNCTIPIYIKE